MLEDEDVFSVVDDGFFGGLSKLPAKGFFGEEPELSGFFDVG